MIKRLPNRYGNKSYWLCRCTCGNEKEVSGATLVNGTSKQCSSCSTKKIATTHGYCSNGKKISEYHIWHSMKERCRNTKNAGWKNYGGRGITVCERWANSFPNFMEDMGLKPFEKASIDRIDNSKGYSPDNCRWVDRITQNRNTRLVKLIDGKPQSQFCREKDICRFWFAYQLKKGKSVYEIINLKNAPKFKHHLEKSPGSPEK